MSGTQKFIKYGSKTMPMGEMTLDEARRVMALHFPELANEPKVEKKEEGDKTVYVFTKQSGKKGGAKKLNLLGWYADESLTEKLLAILAEKYHVTTVSQTAESVTVEFQGTRYWMCDNGGEINVGRENGTDEPVSIASTADRRFPTLTLTTTAYRLHAHLSGQQIDYDHREGDDKIYQSF